MSNAAAYCVWRQMRQAREARVAIGIPLIVPPQQMPEEHEAWVAIGVPLIGHRPQGKLSPYEKPLIRCFVIVVGILFTVFFVTSNGPLYAKIISTCLTWVLPIGILKITYEPDDDLLEDIA